jgi:hypothetical protein
MVCTIFHQEELIATLASRVGRQLSIVFPQRLDEIIEPGNNNCKRKFLEDSCASVTCCEQKPKLYAELLAIYF